MAHVWLITGSARGLGRAIAEGVLAADDKLIATARNPQQLADLVERYGDNVRAVALDVTDARAAIAAVSWPLTCSAGSMCWSTTPAMGTWPRSRTRPFRTSAPNWRPISLAS